MTNEEKALIKAKKIECWIGFFFLILAVLGVMAFTLAMFGVEGDFVKLRNLSFRWLAEFGDNGGYIYGYYGFCGCLYDKRLPKILLYL